MATNEQEIQKMFERMDANQFAAPSARSRVPQSSPDDFHSMFSRMDSQSKPDDFHSMFQRMDAGKPQVTSTVRDDVDFTDEAGPVKDYKPLDLKEESPTLAQRAARGAMTLSGVDGLPVGHPDTWLQELTAVVPSSGRLPSRDELSAAMLSAMGGQAAEVGRRYRNETGRNLVEPDIDDTHLQDGYDEASKTYRIKFNPTLRIKRVIDAYGRVGCRRLKLKSR